MLVMAIQESKRIERQLQGRTGRQGDPGETCTIVGTDDPLIASTGLDVGMNLIQPFFLTGAPSPVVQVKCWLWIAGRQACSYVAQIGSLYLWCTSSGRSALQLQHLGLACLQIRRNVLCRETIEPKEVPYEWIRGRLC